MKRESPGGEEEFADLHYNWNASRAGDCGLVSRKTRVLGFFFLFTHGTNHSAIQSVSISIIPHTAARPHFSLLCKLLIRLFSYYYRRSICFDRASSARDVTDRVPQFFSWGLVRIMMCKRSPFECKDREKFYKRRCACFSIFKNHLERIWMLSNLNIRRLRDESEDNKSTMICLCFSRAGFTLSLLYEWNCFCYLTVMSIKVP